jgi:membrane protease YdiL (CAAX protease family)
VNQRVERVPAGANEYERGAGGQKSQRQFDRLHRLEEQILSRLRSADRIGELHDGHRYCHRASEEEGIETDEKAGDEQNRTEEFGVSGDVAEKRRNAEAGEVLHERGDATLAEDLRVSVRDEHEADGEAQQQRGNIRGSLVHDRLITPVALFVCFYLATFWILLFLRAAPFQWIALASACCGTVATIALWNHGEWQLGLTPRFAPRELFVGTLFAVVLIGSADLLIVALTPLRHARGSGFPFRETLGLFVPSALHEELVFRGYPYQVIRRTNRVAAIVLSSIVFALLHAGNDDVTLLALLNIGFGGVILALAYEWYERLWMPIGLHLAWNLMSGPILGYDVSGFSTGTSVFTTIVKGPPLLTGGSFGVEASILMTGVELAAIVVLASRIRTRNSEISIQV